MEGNFCQAITGVCHVYVKRVWLHRSSLLARYNSSEQFCTSETLVCVFHVTAVMNSLFKCEHLGSSCHKKIREIFPFGSLHQPTLTTPDFEGRMGQEVVLLCLSHVMEGHQEPGQIGNMSASNWSVPTFLMAHREAINGTSAHPGCAKPGQLRSSCCCFSPLFRQHRERVKTPLYGEVLPTAFQIIARQGLKLQKA